MRAGASAHRQPLWVRVVLLAVTVGAAVTALAAASSIGSCSGSGQSGADEVCFSLVRTLSERIGVVAAVATAIVVLTMVGLSRLAASNDRRSFGGGPSA